MPHVLRPLVCLLAAFALIAPSSPARAARRRDCALACIERIAGCVQACGEYSSVLARTCKKGVVRDCMRRGTGVCDVSTTSTTTTLSPPTTIPGSPTTLPQTPTTLPGTSTTFPNASTTSSTRVVTTSTTSTTIPQIDVTLSVNSATSVLCDGNPAKRVSLTICAVNGASGVSLNPGYFSVTQGGISYDYSSCTFSIPMYCDSGVTLSSPACFTCGLVFEFNDNGTARTLTYDKFNLEPASVQF